LEFVTLQTNRSYHIINRFDDPLNIVSSNRQKAQATKIMKFSASTVLVFCLATTTTDAYSIASFVPRTLGSSTFVRRRTTTTTTAKRAKLPIDNSRRRVGGSMVMLVETSGGMEELAELTEKMEKPELLSRQARKSPQLLKLAGIATIPVSAAIGFGLVPPVVGQSSKLAAQAVSALVTGIAGAVGKSRLDALTDANAKPALAQALIDNGLSNIQQTSAAVLKVRDDFGLTDEDFSLFCTELYASYLLGMVKYMPTAKTTELKELENVKSVLGLTNLQVGEGHAEAAREWYRTTSIFTPDEELEDPKNPDRLAMDKLLFLTERVLKQNNETEEAFKFEMSRVAKAFRLDLSTALERVADIAEPFYDRALKSTRAKLATDQVSSDMLQRARQTLGISDAVAKDMHVACFNQEVRSLLGLAADSNKNKDDDDDENVDDDEEIEEQIDYSTAKFSDEDAERVSLCCHLQSYLFRGL
jgi:hypothetical protein